MISFTFKVALFDNGILATLTISLKKLLLYDELLNEYMGIITPNIFPLLVLPAIMSWSSILCPFISKPSFLSICMENIVYFSLFNRISPNSLSPDDSFITKYSLSIKKKR